MLDLYKHQNSVMDNLVSATLNNGVKIPLLGYSPEIKVCSLPIVVELFLQKMLILEH